MRLLAPHARRPQSAREDYLRYLQMEMNFESLMRVRRKRLGQPPNGASVYAVRKRTHFIFSRATRRFKGDERMWLQWIDYAERTKAHNRLGQARAGAIMREPELVCRVSQPVARAPVRAVRAGVRTRLVDAAKLRPFVDKSGSVGT